MLQLLCPSWSKGVDLRSTVVRLVGSNPTGSTRNFADSLKATSHTKNDAVTFLHQPGIEPGAPRWQREILPLNHWCLHQLVFVAEVYDYEIYTPIASGGKQNLPDRELNPGHPLTTILSRRIPRFRHAPNHEHSPLPKFTGHMSPPVGLEPTTTGLKGQRSTD